MSRTDTPAPHPAEHAEGRLRTFVRIRAGGLPGAFWVLWGGTLVNRIGSMVNPFLSLYLTGIRGVPISTAGLILATVGVGSVISQPLGGFIADRFGRRVALSGGMLANGATLLTLGHAHGLGVLVPACFVLGITIDFFRPAAQALVADTVPTADRTRAFGLLLWSVNLGFSMAMVLGGYLASHGYQLIFWLDAGACTAFAALVWLAVPETQPAAGEHSTGGGFLTPVRDRAMLAFAGIIVVYATVFQQAFATLPLAMRGDGLSSTAYGTVMAVNGVVVIAAQPLIGHRLGAFDKSRVLATGFGVAAVGTTVTAFASTALVYGLAIAVWTLGEILVFAMTSSVVADLAPAHLRGRYNGLIGMAWGTGFLLAPVVGTRLLLVGPTTLWLTAACLCLVAAAGQLTLAPVLRRRTAQ
ncbi:MDR family MFS transporter [Streptomyces sp. NBC_01089]|uniref:MDR family MFS transporter n=1 Tax=Streptomyces sp. NBC_01089 TaxID=2903747 RepID=UPI003866E824|nr:MFS transporter [Streptomyces sp. NBC_01089]